jgi:tetratricopeptide (TPR) repeat protein
MAESRTAVLVAIAANIAIAVLGRSIRERRPESDQMAARSRRARMMAEHATARSPERDAPMRREMTRLVILGLLAVAAFFATRAIAASNRHMTLRDAAEWYRRGERQLNEGNGDAAIDSFRRAAAKDRGEKRYVLALADALAREGQPEAARSALIALRYTSPEDRDVNVQLARLAAARHDVAAAIRYYRDALYAAWPLEEAGARRTLRLELVDMMLRQQHTGQALAELQALASDLPDDAALDVVVAQRFARAGDVRRALRQFQRAVRATPDAPEALAGAGLAAFRLGEYELARRYLHRAPDDAEGVLATRTIADLIVESDPLARGLRSAERRRRLVADLGYATHRLDGCLAKLGGSAGPLDELVGEAQTFVLHLRRSRALDGDALEHGLELVGRLGPPAVDRCPPATPRDRALALIVARHGSTGP